MISWIVAAIVSGESTGRYGIGIFPLRMPSCKSWFSNSRVNVISPLLIVNVPSSLIASITVLAVVTSGLIPTVNVLVIRS